MTVWLMWVKSGSENVVVDKLEKLFPPWTVTRDFWQAALRPDVSGVAVDVRLFHDSRCQLVHKYRVFRDSFPHPALRGKVMNKLLGLVSRAMAIAYPIVSVDPSGVVRPSGHCH